MPSEDLTALNVLDKLPRDEQPEYTPRLRAIWQADSEKPARTVSEDMNLFQYDDGQAYLLYDDGLRNIHVDRPAPDYLTSTGEGVVALKLRQEAPAMVKCDGRYIVAGSGVRGWNATETHYAVAKSPMGPYGPKKRMSENNTWGGQITDLVYLRESKTIMAMCDMWWNPDKADLNSSRYLWLPVDVYPRTDTARIRYVRQWVPLQTPGDAERSEHRPASAR